MATSIIEQGVREVIAQNSRYTANEIRLKASLDVYVSSSIARRFAAELKRRFPKIDAQDMVHQLFITLKTVKAVVDNVETYYADAADEVKELAAIWGLD